MTMINERAERGSADPVIPALSQEGRQ